MKQYITNSEKETRSLAEKLAKNFEGILALSGDLGAGKTTFVQGFAKGLGIKGKIVSPTFVLIRQHSIPNSKRFLYHIDLYRIKGDFKGLGLEEILSSPENIVLMEWAEKLENLPKDSKKILIQKQGQNKRMITLS